MTMPGGGPHRVGPGQITDDSELAMCLLQGIVDGNSHINPDQESILPTKHIAGYYGKWIATGPFDIGMATRAALGNLHRNKDPKSAKLRAFNSNKES